MNYNSLNLSPQDISILIITIIISLSGLFVNIIKNDKKEKTIVMHDGKTLTVFRVFIPLALFSGVLIYFTHSGHYQQAPFFLYAGYLLVAAGLLIRWFAIISLGDAFKVKVSILKDQQLKTDGLYKTIRHPSYTGLLFYYAGLGIVMQNWLCLSILTIVPVLVILQRIPIEEQVLSAHFGDTYRAYALKTRKLLPFVF